MTSIWHANSRLCKLRRETRLAKRPAEMACVGMHPPQLRPAAWRKVCAAARLVLWARDSSQGDLGKTGWGTGRVKLLLGGCGCWAHRIRGPARS